MVPLTTGMLAFRVAWLGMANFGTNTLPSDFLGMTAAPFASLPPADTGCFSKVSLASNATTYG
jgi:hypothetical protein